MPKTLLRNLCKNSPNIDMTLQDHFEKELLSSTTNTASIDARAPPQSHRSSMFLAIELGGADTDVKTYFMPMIKSLDSNQTRSQVLFQSINSLHRDHPNTVFPGFNGLIDYMANDALGSQTEVEMVAVDCVTPSMARVKIYLRSQEASWECLCSILTMNGQIKVSRRAFEKMRPLWQLVLSLEHDISTAQQLPASHRSEAGTFYCFYARPGVAEFTPISISCEPKGDDVSVTSYFSPEIYYPTRKEG
ncbi:MAG: hypothetical protein ASARMPREDX12_006348 [Alectoria sarmentosa]|nr:MAG: hypothetical protein ASARMPREDX12_006348 [Alectoria sarmentosa]